MYATAIKPPCHPRPWSVRGQLQRTNCGHGAVRVTSLQVMVKYLKNIAVVVIGPWLWGGRGHQLALTVTLWTLFKTVVMRSIGSFVKGLVAYEPHFEECLDFQHHPSKSEMFDVALISPDAEPDTVYEKLVRESAGKIPKYMHDYTIKAQKVAVASLKCGFLGNTAATAAIHASKDTIDHLDDLVATLSELHVADTQPCLALVAKVCDSTNANLVAAQLMDNITTSQCDVAAA